MIFKAVYEDKMRDIKEEVVVAGFLGADIKAFMCVCIKSNGEIVAIPNWQLNAKGVYNEFESSATESEGAVV